MITVEDEAELDRVMAGEAYRVALLDRHTGRGTARKNRPSPKRSTPPTLRKTTSKNIADVPQDLRRIYGYTDISLRFLSTFTPAIRTTRRAAMKSATRTGTCEAVRAAQPLRRLRHKQQPDGQLSGARMGIYRLLLLRQLLVDKKVREITDDAELLVPKPDSSIGSTSESEGASFSFGGNFGFSGLAASAGSARARLQL